MPSATKRTGPGWMTLALLSFAQLIVSLDYTIVYVALPDISGIGFSSATLQLVVSAYAIAFGGVLLLGGRAADLFGRRRMFIAGLGLYGLASLAGGLADSPALLIAARALQGIGGAVLFPATLSLVNTLFAEGPARNRALGVWAGAGAGGMVAGVLLGGILTAAVGWEGVFFVNVPLTALAILAALRLLPVEDRTVARQGFDLPGAFAATLGMTLVLYALVSGPQHGWGSAEVLGAAAAGLLALAGFVAIEARSVSPLLPLRLLTARSIRLGVTITLLFMATFGTLLYFLTVYLQGVRGFSPLGTGVACLVPMGAVFIGSNLGGRIMTRFGLRTTLVANLLLGALGMGAFGLTLSADSSYLAMVPGLVVLSFGQGVVFPSMFAAVATSVADHDQGVASGVASSGQQIGSAIGLAVLVAIANAGTEGLHGEALRVASADGIHEAVLIAAAVVVLIAVVAWRLERPEPAARTWEAAPQERSGIPS